MKPPPLPDRLTLEFDGCVEPVNPGGTGAWAYRLVGPDPAEGRAGALVECAAPIPARPALTNNIAEYYAVGFGLKYLAEAGWNGRLLIRGDSKLVVEQLCGRWACNAAYLQKLRARCWDLLRKIRPAEWRAEWVPRERNDRCDALAAAAWEEATGRPFPARPRQRRAKR